jgi:hypothetical protein
MSMRGAVLKAASPGFSCDPGQTSELGCRRLSLAIGTDGGLSYWTSAIFGPDDGICA